MNYTWEMFDKFVICCQQITLSLGDKENFKRFHITYSDKVHFNLSNYKTNYVN